jgi:hypothetical protein
MILVDTPPDTDTDTGRCGLRMSRYRLSQVARMVGVAPITLKRCLLDGRLDEVGRDRNNWRVFTEKDVERIRAYINATRRAEKMPLFRRART